MAVHADDMQPPAQAGRHDSDCSHLFPGTGGRAARLVADARALDPARGDLRDIRDAAIAASAPPPGRSAEPEPAGHWRTCTESHPHQDAYLAARRPAGADAGRSQDGHPVSAFRQHRSARLIAAGFTTSSPEPARIKEWNRGALERTAITPAGQDEQAEPK